MRWGAAVQVLKQDFRPLFPLLECIINRADRADGVPDRRGRLSPSDKFHLKTILSISYVPAMRYQRLGMRTKAHERAASPPIMDGPQRDAPAPSWTTARRVHGIRRAVHIEPIR
ncbi:hypothetical protein EVAR_89172_1 [Eumeta japonica]|uniref:Uncharacterized protein n=1 Tax=Eumeta variegata TaxID=151549 RepID=A0A4C2A443_EUMVA|nr:hypothetical protein EVAR_89172_1 [Eumeta japonica]